MPGLEGRHVAVLESRLGGELSEIVRRFGGLPRAVPAVRELSHLDEVPRFVDSLTDRRWSLVIFLTGVGATTLLREADRLGRLDVALDALRATIVAGRGPKPIAALNRYGVPVHIRTAAPHTTTELLEALAGVELPGAPVALVHYGERNQVLADALMARGGKLDECVLYEWALPEDPRPLAELVDALIGRQLDAIVFTSQIQCRNLFEIADRAGRADALAGVLVDHTLVAAIGPVCAEALRARCVIPDVIPDRPKMGPLIEALADFIDLSADSHDGL